MKYTKGMSYTEQFGGHGDRIDAFGFCVFGDINHPAAQYACDAAGFIEHTEQAALTDHQKFSIWFRFAKLKPYGEVVQLLDNISAELENAGWKIAEAIEDLPDTGSNINDLVDTGDFQFIGKPEADFPNKSSIGGFNAAHGFSIVVEKLGTKPEFSEEEILEIRRIAKELGQIVYGRDLQEEA